MWVVFNLAKNDLKRKCTIGSSKNSVKFCLFSAKRVLSSIKSVTLTEILVAR
jgi:hypothetical protein